MALVIGIRAEFLRSQNRMETCLIDSYVIGIAEWLSYGAEKVIIFFLGFENCSGKFYFFLSRARKEIYRNSTSKFTHRQEAICV